jgi:endonuclease/exonuclease/phosphatase family metal-dependent hydrolase
LQIAPISRNHSTVSDIVPTAPFPEIATRPNKGIEIGGPSAASDDGLGHRSSLILASYNIRYAVGSHLIPSGLLRKAGLNLPRQRAAAVARNIKRAAKVFSDNVLLPRPDILALQEADKATGRAGRQHVAAKLADELQVPYVHVGAGIPRGVPPEQREWWLNFEEQIELHDPGDTGVALLSRLPLSEITRIDLPWHGCMWRPRLAMGVTFRVAEQRVRLYNVHVDPHGPLGNQHQQIEALLGSAGQDDGPKIVLGDFNTLSKQKAVEIRKLMEANDYSTPFPTGAATWRGAGLRFQADWIFVKDLDVKRWGVVRPLSVSDHWPIWAELSLPVSDCHLPMYD